MSSYDAGSLYGYMQAVKWLKKNTAMPTMKMIQSMATVAYDDKLHMFQCLDKQDFLDGYTDAVECAYKGEKLAVA
jgi:hypothetical protein